MKFAYFTCLSSMVGKFNLKPMIQALQAKDTQKSRQNTTIYCSYTHIQGERDELGMNSQEETLRSVKSQSKGLIYNLHRARGFYVNTRSLRGFFVILKNSAIKIKQGSTNLIGYLTL